MLSLQRLLFHHPIPGGDTPIMVPFLNFRFHFEKGFLLPLVLAGGMLCNSPVAAQSSLRDDPRFRDYQAQDRSRTVGKTSGAESVASPQFQPVPTPPPSVSSPQGDKAAGKNAVEPSVTPSPLPSLEPIEAGKEKVSAAPVPAEEGSGLLYVPAGKRQDIPVALPWLARHEVERISPSEARKGAGRSATVSRAPILATLDLEHTRAVEPNTADSLSQVVWNAAQRVRGSQLKNRAYCQRVLAERGLTATDPYKMPPAPKQVASALDVDYLITGNLNKIEGVFVVELQLYNVSQDRVVSSLASEALPTPEALIEPIRDLVQKLIASVPAAVVVNPASGGAESLKVASFKPESSGAKKPASASRNGEEKKPLKEQKRVVAKDKSKSVAKPTLKPTPAPVVTPVAEAPAGETPRPEGVLPAPTPEPTPAVEGAVPQPTPAPEAVSPKPTPAPAVTPTPAPAAAKTPTPTPAAADGKKQAREAYDKAIATPKDSPEGLAAAQEAVRLDPGNEEFEGELLQRLYQTGKHAEAAELGKRVAVLSNDPNVLLYTSAAHAALGQHQKAIEVLDILLKKQPKNGFALYNKAVSLSYLDPKKAKEAFQVYLNNSKDDPEQAAWVQDAQQKLQQLQGGDGKGQ
jgi:tetratricopeptide (TPR) repeat protein